MLPPRSQTLRWASGINRNPTNTCSQACAYLLYYPQDLTHVWKLNIAALRPAAVCLAVALLSDPSVHVIAIITPDERVHMYCTQFLDFSLCLVILEQWCMKVNGFSGSQTGLKKNNSPTGRPRCSLFLHGNRLEEMLYYITWITNGSSAENGCRQNESPNKNITIIHTPPVHQLKSCEEKSCMPVRNKSSIKVF